MLLLAEDIIVPYANDMFLFRSHLANISISGSIRIRKNIDPYAHACAYTYIYVGPVFPGHKRCYAFAFHLM